MTARSWRYWKTMTTSVTKTALAATGGVVAAVVSTLCCAGPLVAVALGLSGAGLAVTFKPSATADRKSTRLNSSHLVISYAVFCLKKKKKKNTDKLKW